MYNHNSLGYNKMLPYLLWFHQGLGLIQGLQRLLQALVGLVQFGRPLGNAIFQIIVHAPKRVFGILAIGDVLDDANENTWRFARRQLKADVDRIGAPVLAPR